MSVNLDTRWPNVDLHSHSHCSDGMLAPAVVAQRAHANGVHVWALSDHDVTSGLAAAASAARALGLRFVPGVEISVTWSGHTIHVLGLNIDPAHPELVEGLAHNRTRRRERATRLSARLETLGIHGALDGALRHADNPELIGRMHFARYLLEQGHCKTLRQAFNRYLGDGRPGCVDVQWASLPQALGWIAAAGGKAVLAHPARYRYRRNERDALFTQFKALGGQGIEVITGLNAPVEHRTYAQLARQYGFEASRGSDFHAPRAGRADLGRMPDLPPDLVPIWHEWV